MSSITDVSSPELSLPTTARQLFRALTSGALMPGLAGKTRPTAANFAALAGYAAQYRQLLARLASLPQLAQILQVQPGLPCRLHRPRLSINISREQAANALCWHYENMLKRLPAILTNAYLSKAGTELVMLNGKDEQTYFLRLHANAMQDKEGEATLEFCDAQQTTLAELTFTLCPFEGKSTLYIGGLQGAKAHVPHDLIQSATKACHGLFPKRLLVEAAMTLGAIHGGG